MQQFLQEYKTLIEQTAERLLSLSDTEIYKKRNKDDWSPIEILGHLIDSACNNHRRFVLAQFNDDLIFDGYDQDEWTATQKYESEEWQTIVSLWMNYNLHIIHLCSQIPENILVMKRSSHNLDEIAWKKVDKSSPATLGYFIKDYFGHLEHHINQLLATIKPH